MKEYFGSLVACPLFSGMEEEMLSAQLQRLGAKLLTVKKGGVILREGDPARSFGVVLSGRAQVIRMDYFGNRSIVAEVTPSQLFGEVFACAGVQILPVSVTAAADTTALMLDAQKIMGEGEPFSGGLVLRLLKIVAEKTLLMNRKIDVVSKRTTREKLMTYLLGQAKMQGSSQFRIPFDRQELADYLEVEQSGLSAEIGKLRREGVLSCRRSEFTLL